MTDGVVFTLQHEGILNPIFFSCISKTTTIRALTSFQMS